MADPTRKVALRRPRRWVLHAAWAALSITPFLGGIWLGMRWSGASLGTMAMENQRAESFGRMRIALEALDANDPGALRRGAVRLLYNATFSLAGVPRYFDCKPPERDVMSRAKARLEADSPPISDDYVRYRNMAYAFCDKAPESVSFP